MAQAEAEQPLTERYPIAGGPPALADGDRILWEGRSEPLTVIEEAHEDGKHSDVRDVAAEGPRGGVTTLSREVTSRSWKTDSDGAVDSVVIVEEGDREPVAAGKTDPVTTAWDGPLDDCPFCGHLDRFSSQNFRCHYVTSGLWGGSPELRNAPIERTDAGAERAILRAECVKCGGIVYEHPAYSLLFDGDSGPTEFPPEKIEG
ncbi:hypothetical protein [Halorhabdus rudnickae]|uniref:hypothetical protein n=1 Tax=Halorhabdus rudnickae TaxID=1775544 RepID=UPI0010829F7C|nr:hypothetical protein [Halorhabdus rudnickae]